MKSTSPRALDDHGAGHAHETTRACVAPSSDLDGDGRADLLMTNWFTAHLRAFPSRGERLHPPGPDEAEAGPELVGAAT